MSSLLAGCVAGAPSSCGMLRGRRGGVSSLLGVRLEHSLRSRGARIVVHDGGDETQRLLDVLNDKSVTNDEKVKLVASVPPAVVDDMMLVDKFATAEARRLSGRFFTGWCRRDPDQYPPRVFQFALEVCVRRLTDLHARGLLDDEVLKRELSDGERLLLSAICLSKASFWDKNGTRFSNGSGYTFVSYKHLLHCLTGH